MHSKQQEQHDNDEPEQRVVDPQQQQVDQKQTDRYQEQNINVAQDVGEQEEVDVVVIGGGLAGVETY